MKPPPLEVVIVILLTVLSIAFAVIFRACIESDAPIVTELPLPPLPPADEIEFCSLKKTTPLTAEERRILCLHEINR